MKTLALAAILPVCLSSCSSVFDAADISGRRAKAISKGEVVSGDGFSVRAPEAGLYPSSRVTRPGGVTLRPTEPMMDGLVYIVTPFDAKGVSTPREALNQWLALPKARGYPVKILDGEQSSFQGLASYRATVEVSIGSITQVTSNLISKRSTDYLVLCAGHPNLFPRTRAERVSFTAKGLRSLQSSTTIRKR